MTKAIYFDMDGTIADLYGVTDWLNDLINENTRPYEIARPLVNMSQLAKQLNKLSRKGYTINIISWTSRGGSNEYNKAVATAKKKWLAKHLPSVKFTEIYIIPYGTPKSKCGFGILFDDEKPNRDNWTGTAYKETEIFEILKKLG